jgi:hypothetical protein
MIGKTYLLRGEPVTVLARWAEPASIGSGFCPLCGRVLSPERPYLSRVSHPCDALRRFRASALVTVPVLRQGPRNVLIEYVDGHRSVRPFRGLRCMERVA